MRIIIRGNRATVLCNEEVPCIPQLGGLVPRFTVSCEVLVEGRKDLRGQPYREIYRLDWNEVDGLEAERLL